jgi:hypothetical protein
MKLKIKNMIRFLKNLIQKYITCNHEDYKVIKKISANKPFVPRYFEKRRCLKCDIIYKSAYFIDRVNMRKI